MLTGRKVIIFDMDGTLIDSVGIWNQVDELLIARLRRDGGCQPENYQLQRDEALRRFRNEANPYMAYCRFLRELPFFLPLWQLFPPSFPLLRL